MLKVVSTRYKMSIITTLILAIVGTWAYVYDPEHIDKFAFYLINTVLPVIGYIVGRTIRGQNNTSEDKKLLPKSTRYRFAFFTFVGSVILGIIAYIYSPENIDKFGMLMIGVVLPGVGFILGRTFKGASEKEKEESDNII